MFSDNAGMMPLLPTARFVKLSAPDLAGQAL